MDALSFTFSDTIAGYVTSFEASSGTFGLRTTDGREFPVKLTDATYVEVIRNLGEPFQDPGARIERLLVPSRYLYATASSIPKGAS